MRNWMNLFSSKILDRGYDYYKMGMIESLEVKDYGYEARVDGTEEYEVRIYLEDEEIKEMYCSCPYAQDGNHCKHMAAVLYEINNEDFEVDVIDEECEMAESTEDIGQIIDGVSKKELKDFLVSLAKENEVVRNAISARFSSFDGNQLQSILTQICEITDKYSHNGYINYYNAWDYGHEMSSFLCENATILIDRNKLKEAFKLVTEVFLEVAVQELDDSDGMISMIANDCVEYWNKIISLSDESFRNEMFNHFKRILKNGLVMDYMEDIIEQLLFESFNDKSILKEKLNYLDSEIKYLTKKYKTDHYVSYKLSEFIKQRLLVMHELGCSHDEIRDYRNQYRFLSSIRQIEINEYIEENDYVHAAEVLKESIELDKKYYGLVHDYKTQLIDIYDRMGDISAYQALLKDYVLNDTQYNLEYVLKMKAISTRDEWKKYRELIIQNGRSTKVSYYLLEHEEEYERLIEEIKKANNIYLLNEFEKTLKAKLPEATMKAYCEYVVTLARNASSRGMYKDVIKYLKKIKTYSNSTEELDKIVSDFKVNYKRRPAMMDELRKAGF